ncbi:MAG: thiamine-phosphate pyrophosphorylase [Oleiphilaceae bacterium]
MSTKFPNGLYAITDPRLLPTEKLITSVESALRGGARVIQYRDKIASEIERVKNAQNLRDLCTDYQATFIINDDLGLCQRINADGLHLGKSDGDVAHARNTLGDAKILGVTCHSDLAYAQNCIEQGVDYCAFGRIFPSNTKPNAPHCSQDTLKLAAKLLCPSVAIGGITVDNVPNVIAANIHSIAVIHGLFGQQDIEASARIFSSLFKSSHT